MLTILSFFITLIGGINWLMIGLLQYDFIAGIFGYQASVFSRLIYIVFGLASMILLFKMIKGRGNVAVFSRRNKNDLKKNIDKIQSPAPQNVEASRDNFESYHSQPSPPQHINFDPNYPDYANKSSENVSNEEGLFDEHLGKR